MILEIADIARLVRLAYGEDNDNFPELEKVDENTSGITKKYYHYLQKMLINSKFKDNKLRTYVYCYNACGKFSPDIIKWIKHEYVLYKVNKKSDKEIISLNIGHLYKIKDYMQNDKFSGIEKFLDNHMNANISNLDDLFFKDLRSMLNQIKDNNIPLIETSLTRWEEEYRSLLNRQKETEYSAS